MKKKGAPSGATASAAASPAKQSTGVPRGPMLLILAVAAVLVAVIAARRGGNAAQDGGIVFVDRLASGAYPNVTGRIQILGA
jgi:hypothetical protein